MYFGAFHLAMFSGLHSSIRWYKITSIAGNKILCPLFNRCFVLHAQVGLESGNEAGVSLGMRLVVCLGTRLVSVWEWGWLSVWERGWLSNLGQWLQQRCEIQLRYTVRSVNNGRHHGTSVVGAFTNRCLLYIQATLHKISTTGSSGHNRVVALITVDRFCSIVFQPAKPFLASSRLIHKF